MPRKKTEQAAPPPEPQETEEFDVEESEDSEVEAGSSRPGLDIYDENGDLVEEGEPTYIEEDEDSDSDY